MDMRTIQVVPHVEAPWGPVAVAELGRHEGLQTLEGELTECVEGQVVVGLENVSLNITTKTSSSMG